jgi:hypothetical protein
MLVLDLRSWVDEVTEAKMAPWLSAGSEHVAGRGGGWRYCVGLGADAAPALKGLGLKGLRALKTSLSPLVLGWARVYRLVGKVALIGLLG